MLTSHIGTCKTEKTVQYRRTNRQRKSDFRVLQAVDVVTLKQHAAEWVLPGSIKQTTTKKANKSSAFLVIISKICIMTVLTVWCGKFQIHNTNQNKKTKICRQIK